MIDEDYIKNLCSQIENEGLYGGVTNRHYAIIHEIESIMGNSVRYYTGCLVDLIKKKRIDDIRAHTVHALGWLGRIENSAGMINHAEAERTTRERFFRIDLPEPFICQQAVI
ncbi:hypothetical protein FBZ90_106219 [Nitrospirillum pindoramense]|uniref:Uncharacterized protein n=1 Tax=Nitrospirillum amazonense TaxID=28077 RepID=A0A560HA02_9PROT|nr:hypothetical protein FBZ90_106219 [Nitrospirillum amazonense]